MYTLNVTNDYPLELHLGGTPIPPQGGTGSETGSTMMLTVPGMGELIALDLGENKLPGYNLEQTWGVLLRYGGLELYYRYEGGGRLDLTVDAHGCVHVTSVQGSALVVKLDDLRLDLPAEEPAAQAE